MLLLVLASTADASAYYVADVGTRSLGRGGAFIAGVDDTTAQYYNPAALTRIDGGQFKVDLSGVHQYIRFDREDIGTEVFEPVENLGPPYPIPTIGLAQSFMGDRAVIAFGVYPPYAPFIEYDREGAQRYTLVDSTVIEVTAGPSAAFEIIPGLSVGVGGQYKWMLAGQQLFLTTSGDDDPTGQIGFDMEASDPFTLSWNAGVLFEDPKNQRWAVGVGFVPPVKYEAEGYLRADFTDHTVYPSIISEAKPSDEDITLLISMPMQVKAGALFRPTDKLEIEAATVFQKWDVVEEIVVTDLDMEIDSALGEPIVVDEDVVLPAGYKNTWSARLGAEFDAHEMVTARAGILWEGGAIPDATTGVSLVDGNKYGYGLGGTVWLGKRWAVDAAWHQSFMPTRTITDSELTQIKLGLDGSVGEGRVVGNGDLTSRFNIGSIALQGVWGAGVRD